jgi:L-ascorbate metabolism protein UlaG (beta-lactamase superfamily)
MPGPNKGGTQEIDGIKFTLTNAFHSSSSDDGAYLGEPAGIVIRADGKSIYFAGDTCVFGDMALIERLYKPDVAVLPIGDHFTMGPEEAALALELLGSPRCVPCHWGTFGLLTGTPDKLAELTGATVERVEPGGSVEL